MVVSPCAIDHHKIRTPACDCIEDAENVVVTRINERRYGNICLASDRKRLLEMWTSLLN